MSLRPVSASDLEQLLSGLKDSVAKPREGLFGPDSISWKINRESALFLAAGRAALLQLAHPWVATAIAQHSRTLNDPIVRFHNTFRVIFTMIFGTAEQAFTAARQLHRLHSMIRGVLAEGAGSFAKGSSYEANEASALCWVYATLVDSALIAYELLLPPLADPEREQYVVESIRMAALFGIAPHYLPPSHAEFNAYMDAMLRSDVLGVSPSTRQFAQRLQQGAGLMIPPPAWYRSLTIEILPPRLRDEFQLTHDDRDKAAVSRTLAWLRRIYAHLPYGVRFVGPYNEAKARLHGRLPGLAVRLSNRVWVGQSTLLVAPQ
jgi:uncharacterized protein (DUF2236 family)